MTYSNVPTTPAGWYPDPAGSPRSRWWDGTQWTENFHDPLAAAQIAGGPLKAPENTPIYNPFTWVLVALAVGVVLISLRALDPALIDQAMNPDPNAPVYDPMTLVNFAINMGLTAAFVTFSYLDYRRLVAQGVPKPFHWAWSFFALLVYPLYLIGRGVVMNKRTGRGISTMWIAIASIVAQFAIVIYAFALIFEAAMSAVPGAGF